MAEYKYSALTTKGEEVKGTVEAPDRMGAIHAVREQGLFPIKVRNLSGQEQEEIPEMNDEEIVQRYIDALPKSYNPVILFKNYIRRKILLGSPKKQKVKKKNFLLQPDAITCHILCPAFIVILSCDLLSGKSKYSDKELTLAIIFITVAYVFVLFLLWLKVRLDNMQPISEMINSKSSEEICKLRKILRICSLVLINLIGVALVILGHKGWTFDFIPVQYLGYGLLIFGALGFLGVNIWYNGPIDPKNDPSDRGDI